MTLFGLPQFPLLSLNQNINEVRKNKQSKININKYIDDFLEYVTKTIESKNHKITENDTSEYVLLPVWMLNVKFKDKMYTFAMNGQTGKFVGDLPVDKKAYWKYHGIWAAGLTVLVFAIMMVLGLV